MTAEKSATANETQSPSNDPVPARQVKRMSVDIPAAMHARFKGRCAMKGVQMQDVIQELIEEWMSRDD